MSDFWTIRPLRAGEEQAACDLVKRVFDIFVAPEYEPEGMAEFYRYIDPARLRQRTAQGHDVLLAWVGETLVGVAELRAGSHISLLFVEGLFQGRGIARDLMDALVALGRTRVPEIAVMSVNASPNSAMIYEHLGFHATGPRQTRNGITFIPMEKRIEAA